MGQFRWCILAGYLLASVAQAEPVDAGNLFVQFDQMQVESQFERDTRIGAFRHTAEIISMKLTMRGDGKISSPKMSKDQRLVLEPSGLNIAIRRRGEAAEIQFYTVLVDPKKGIALPVVERRKIKLTQGTWEQYEAGKTIVAEVDEPGELEEIALSQRIVAEDYFQLWVLPSIEWKGAKSGEPEINVGKVYPRLIRMNKDHVSITMSADVVQTKAKIQIPDPSEELLKGGRRL